MAISHKDHDHPNTPAARAACRKTMNAHEVTTTGRRSGKAASQPAQMTVVPRRKGDGGVVKGMKAAAPKTLKRENTRIKSIGDLADMPAMLAYGVRLAWAADLDVLVGDRFCEDEARLVIKADRGEIYLVWKVTNPHGLHAIFVRNYDSSKQFKVASVQHALEVCAHDSEAWDEYGNLVGA